MKKLKTLKCRQIKNLIMTGIILFIAMVVGLITGSVTLAYVLLVLVVSAAMLWIMINVDMMIIERKRQLRKEYLEKLHNREAHMYTIE